MPVTESEFRIATRETLDLVNITDRLRKAVAESGIQSGLACVFIPHTTCALALNEDEPGLRQDILRLAELVESLRRKAPFAHDRIDDNAAAHLLSVLLQPSLTIPVAGGLPVLGTWQSLFLVELDGPRQRRVRVVVR